MKFAKVKVIYCKYFPVPHSTKVIKNLINTPNCALPILSFVNHSIFTTPVLVPKKKKNILIMQLKKKMHNSFLEQLWNPLSNR